MSTIKTNRIENRAATTGFDVADVPSAGSFSLRNKVINGGCDIWQRGGPGDLINGTGVYIMDRVWGYLEGTGDAYVEKISYPEVGNAYVVTCLTARADAATGEVDPYIMEFEGNVFYGSNGKDYTLSFKFRATKPGYYYHQFNMNDEIIVNLPFYYNTGDVWQTVVHTWTMPETFDTDPVNDVNKGGRLLIGQITPGSIQAGAANWMDTIGNNIMISQVQIEEGTTNTPFEVLPEAMIQTMCERYYERSYDYFSGSPTLGSSGGLNSTHFRTKKRAAPTMNIQFVEFMNWSGASFHNATTENFRWYINGGSNPGRVGISWRASAEL